MSFSEVPKEFLGSEYVIFEEISPSGQKTRFTVEENSLLVENVSSDGRKVFTSVLLEYDQEHERITATCSDGTTIIYRGTNDEKSPFLQSVEIEGFPLQRFEYVQNAYRGNLWLHKIYTGSKCSLEVDFNLPKIKKTKKGHKLDYSSKAYRVVKTVENEINITTYDYYLNEKGPGDIHTITDVNGNVTKYYVGFRKGFEKILRLKKNGQVFSSEIFDWKGHLLRKKEVKNEHGKDEFIEYYTYSKEEEILTIRSIGGLNSKEIVFHYDDRHNCILRKL